MSEMASQIAKAIFVGNIKGGVGKSTLTVYLTDYLRRRFKRRSVILLDTDPQGTSFELMEPKSKNGDARFLPVGDRYDGVNMTTLDGVLRRLLAQNENGIAMVDTGAGSLAISGKWPFYAIRFWCQPQCHGPICGQRLILSRKLMRRKADLRSVTPHVVVVPNRVSPQQRHFQQIADALHEVNAILAPPISELSAARNLRQIFLALKVLKARGFAAKLSGLANFSLNMSSAASLTGSMTKRPIKARFGFDRA